MFKFQLSNLLNLKIYLNRTTIKSILFSLFSVLFGQLIAQPTIQNFSPTSQLSGYNVEINGTNFGTSVSAVKVKFGGVTGTTVSVASTKIIATVPTGAKSGKITVEITGSTTVEKSGWVYIETIDQIYTDFNNYWFSSTSNLNTTVVDLSHNLLGFRYASSIYSTGVGDSILTKNNVSFTSALWNALPVSTLSGTVGTSEAVYASRNDGTVLVGINPSRTMKDLLIDGIRGLDLGTGVGNFSNQISFTITNIDSSKLNDNEPDILITQVALPSNNTADYYYFTDAQNNKIGSTVSAISQNAPILGSYNIDIFPFNSQVADTARTTGSPTGNKLNTKRDIRLFAFKLSDFGITRNNFDSIKFLKIDPNGTSDIAFVAYNANTFIVPTASISNQPVSTTKCAGSGTSATFSVSASNPTSVGTTGGTITYQWKKNGNNLTNGGNISGSTSNTLVISSISANDFGEYICEITNNFGSILSDPAYLNVKISAEPISALTCINTNPAAFSLNALGNSPSYQWYTNNSNSFANATSISGATSNSYLPPSNSSGTKYYFAIVSDPNASGCTVSDTSNIVSLQVFAASVGGSVNGSQTVCFGSNSTSLTLSGNTGTVQKWQYSSAANFSSPTDLVTSSTTQTATNLTSNRYYRAVVKNGTCPTANSSSALITVNTTYTWEGDVSSNFGTSTNWQEGCVPHTGADISFRTSSAPDRICELDQNRSLRNITIAGTSTTHIFDLNNYTLTTTGTLSTSGSNLDVRDASSTLVFEGSSSQTLPSGSLINNEIARLTINNSAGVSLGGTTNLTRLLTLVSGTLTTSGRLTFKSTADYTAQLAAVPASGASISGNVTVEKYVPARRAFRLLSPSVTTSTSINANWQEGASSYGSNPNPGYGTHITGSKSGSNGLDATITGGASLFSFNNTGQNWSSILNTSTTTLSAGTPYRLMIRGGRSVDIYQSDNNPTPTNTTLRTTGTIFTGNFTVNNLSSTSEADNFVGNPYQSAVDLSQIITSSVSNINSTYVYMWDPFLNTRGGYATVDLSTSSTLPSASTASKYLQPGQAFFVKTAANATGAPSFSFTEASKYTGGTFSTTNLWEIPNRYFELIDITLINKDSQVIADATQVRFSPGFSDELSNLDSRKVLNLDENLSIYKEGTLLSIDSRSTNKTSEQIQLIIDRYRAKNYTLRIKASALPGFTLHLRDKYTNNLTELSNNQETEYSFSVSDLESKRIDRFALELNFPNEVKLKNQELLLSQVKVYPNPVCENTLNVILPTAFLNQPCNLKIIDLNGAVVWMHNKLLLDPVWSIAPNKTWSNGVYLIQVSSANQTLNGRFILQNP